MAPVTAGSPLLPSVLIGQCHLTGTCSARASTNAGPPAVYSFRGMPSVDLFSFRTRTGGADADLQPPTDHHTFIPGEPGREAPMSKTSLILPSHPAATASWLHRRGFLVGAGAAGMALGTGLGSGLHANRSCAGLFAADRAAAARTRPRQGDRHLRLQRHGAGPGVAASRRPSGQHRYPQRYRHRRHHPLARALRALDGRRRDGRRIADGRRAAARSVTRSRRSPPGRAGITATTLPGPT